MSASRSARPNWWPYARGDAMGIWRLEGELKGDSSTTLVSMHSNSTIQCIYERMLSEQVNAAMDQGFSGDLRRTAHNIPRWTLAGNSRWRTNAREDFLPRAHLL